ncbi:hypothetical protein Tco_0195743 [Tanacetum coccineum]
MSTEVHHAAEIVTKSNELDLLFGPLFDEYFNRENLVVSKFSAVTTADASDKKSYALSWKPCQGDSLNLPDHRAQDDSSQGDDARLKISRTQSQKIKAQDQDHKA